MKIRSERQSPQSALRLSEWREIPAQESTVVGEDLFGRNGTLRELGLSEWRELPAQESTSVVGEDLFGRNGTLREVSHGVHCQSSVYLSGVSYQHRSLNSCRRGFVWKEWYAEGSLARSPLSELGLSEWRELPAQESTSVVGEDLFGRNGTLRELGLSEWRELPAQKSTVVGEDLFGRNGTLREVSHGVHSTSTGVYSCRRGFVWKEWYAEGSLAQSPLSELGLSEWRELPAQESTVVGEDLFGRNGTLREVSHRVHSTSTEVYSCRRGFVWKEWYAEGSLARVHCQSSVYLSGVSYGVSWSPNTHKP
ncbi:hypothetical protein J6590_099411, partial [Homalodisca vitripennis]